MRKLSILLVFVLLSSIIAFSTPVKAESGSNYWVKSYGGEDIDVANAVSLTSNGDIIVAGITNSFGTSDYDAFVARLSPDGKVKWFKTYGGNDYDEANAVAVAPNGDIIVAGNTFSFGNASVWVLRLDSNGNVIWQKTYRIGGATSVALAPNGDIIVAGYTFSFGIENVWVLRLDGQGNVIWQKTYGGKYNDEAHAVAVAPNGDIIVAGYYGAKDLSGADANVWVLRLNSNGDIIWQKTYGGSNDDMANAVSLTPNGDIIVVGSTGSFGAGGYDVWVLRLDSQGNIKWQKTYGGSDGDGANTVVLAPNGDIIVAGYTGSFGIVVIDAWVLRLDSNGNVIWQKTYGGRYGEDKAFSVALAPNGDIIVAGPTGSFGVDSYDAWVLRLPPNGELPGCNFCKNSKAQVENTNANMTTPNVQVENTNATVKNSNAIVKSWTPTVKTQYPLSNQNTSVSTTHSSGTFSKSVSTSTSYSIPNYSTPTQSSVTFSGSTSRPITSTTTTKGGICGPALVVLLATTPLLLKRKRR